MTDRFHDRCHFCVKLGCDNVNQNKSAKQNLFSYCLLKVKPARNVKRSDKLSNGSTQTCQGGKFVCAALQKAGNRNCGFIDRKGGWRKNPITVKVTVTRSLVGCEESAREYAENCFWGYATVIIVVVVAGCYLFPIASRFAERDFCPFSRATRIT